MRNRHALTISLWIYENVVDTIEMDRAGNRSWIIDNAERP